MLAPRGGLKLLQLDHLSSTFLGRDLVEWLLRRGIPGVDATRDAVALAQRMLAAGLFFPEGARQGADADFVDADDSVYQFRVGQHSPKAPAALALDKTAAVQEVPRLHQTKFSCEEKPGISDYGTNASRAADRLQLCLRESVAEIPADRLSRAQIHLRATAGMRVLHADSPAQADAVLLACRNAFANSGVGGAVSALILPGELEGAYGWVTSNYLQGVLGFDASSTAPSYGALDMGGASTQITFRVAPSTPLPQGDDYRMRLFGLDETLYTHSYLCYGMNAATNRSAAAILAPAGAGKQTAVAVSSPCLPAGYNRSVAVEDLRAMATELCTNGSGLTPSPVAAATLVGTSNASACAAQTAALAPQPLGSQPLVPTTPVYAFSGFYYAVDYLCAVRNFTGCSAYPDGGWQISPRSLRAAANTLCGEDLATLKAKSPKVKDSFLVNYCFSVTYIISVLSAYQFPDDADNLAFVGQVKGRDVGWTLGFMLDYTTSSSSAPPASKLLGQSSVIGGLVGGAVLMCIGVVACVLLRRRHRHKYAPIS
jgi:hypothetical protein